MNYGLATPFNNFLPEAAFLFGQEITEYLDTASSNWAELHGLEGERDNQGPDRLKNSARASELRKWFFDQATKGVKKEFGAYLNFDQWK